MSKEIIKREKQKVLFKQMNTETNFVSGTDHPMGLHCVFYELENGDLATFFTLDKWCEGHKGFGHGGMCYMVLDEVMGRSNRIYDASQGMSYTPVMTGEITCRYVSPAPLGERLYAYGRVISSDGRKRITSGEILLEDGTVVVRGTGVYFQVPFVSPSEYSDEPDPFTEDDPKEL